MDEKKQERDIPLALDLLVVLCLVIALGFSILAIKANMAEDRKADRNLLQADFIGGSTGYSAASAPSKILSVSYNGQRFMLEPRDQESSVAHFNNRFATTYPRGWQTTTRSGENIFWTFDGLDVIGWDMSTARQDQPRGVCKGRVGEADDVITEVRCYDDYPPEKLIFQPEH